MKNFTIILLGFLTTIFSACGANLHITTLDVGLLNEAYTYQLMAVDDSWDWPDTHEFVYKNASGLPDGVYVSSDGVVFGTPTEVGIYDFLVTVYSIDYDYFDDWDFWDDWDSCCNDSTVTFDSEILTLFVTEANSNPACPSPADRDTQETYICIGSPEVTTLQTNEEVTLDISYHVKLDNAEDYDTDTIDFTIYYDEDLFAIDTNLLNSQLLREAATFADATVSFDDSTPGALRIVMTANGDSFLKPGRLIDLPVYALQNIDSIESPVTLTINGISSTNEKAELPQLVEVDGSITVTGEE